MNQSMDTLASSSAATNLLEAAVHHEAKEIKDQLREMNQSIDTLASSSAANQSSSGKFFFFYNGGAVVEGNMRLFLFQTEEQYSRLMSQRS